MTGARRDLSDHIEGRSSILLLAPHHSPRDDSACIDLLTGVDPRDLNVLSVALSTTPEERLAIWQREVGATPPKRATLVDCGGRTAVASGIGASDAFPSVSVDALPSDAELVDVAISIARHLSEWRSNPESTTLCLHSLTTLLDSFDRDRVRSLVRGLNDLCDCLDVVAHHHMDPTAHAAETVAAFRSEFEVVVEHAPDRGWIVSRDGDAADQRSACVSSSTGSRDSESSATAMAPLPYSLDTALNVLSAARRRSLLYYLRDRDGDGPASLEELVDGVRTRERAVPNRLSTPDADEVRFSLVHTHLPKLDDAGIASYDAEAGLVDYGENRALESCLDYVEMLEYS